MFYFRGPSGVDHHKVVDGLRKLLKPQQGNITISTDKPWSCKFDLGGNVIIWNQMPCDYIFSHLSALMLQLNSFSLRIRLLIRCYATRMMRIHNDLLWATPYNVERVILSSTSSATRECTLEYWWHLNETFISMTTIEALLTSQLVCGSLPW